SIAPENSKRPVCGIEAVLCATSLNKQRWRSSDVKLLIRHLCLTLALLCIASLQAGGAARDTPTSSATNNSSAKAPTASAVRQLTLPNFEPKMPVAPGRDEFMRACVTCHSARYVTMQPPFSRRQWEETVRKMITAYGAPADEV